MASPAIPISAIDPDMDLLLQGYFDGASFALSRYFFKFAQRKRFGLRRPALHDGTGQKPNPRCLLANAARVLSRSFFWINRH